MCTPEDDVEAIAKDDDMLQAQTSARTGDGVADAFMRLSRLIYQKQFIEKGLINEPDPGPSVGGGGKISLGTGKSSADKKTGCC